MVLLRAKAVSDANAEAVLEKLLGWLKKRVDGSIEKGQPAIILYEDFHDELVKTVRKYDRADFQLDSTAPEPSEAAIQQELRSRIYVQQLVALRLDGDHQSTAVRDYLRATSDKTTWAEAGDVHDTSFSEFEAELKRNWKAQRSKISIEQKGKAAEEIGSLVFFTCSGLRLKLQGMETPSHFTPGSFHALADKVDIGWHPDYEALFKGKPVGGGGGS